MTSLNIGGAITDDGKLAGNTATAIFTAVGATWIRSITATENTGAASPSLLIEKYNGTTSYYIRRKPDLVSGVPVILNEPFLLPFGWSIRMTSGDAAGKVDWSITYDAPISAKSRG